jgi:predicted amidohydrolase YtcJ
MMGEDLRHRRSPYPQRNCFDRETALRMWTENVTWFSNEEGKKGRIQVGQLADLIVPDRDYFACSEYEITDIARP